MKKLSALLGTTILALAIAGCSDEDAQKQKSDGDVKQVSSNENVSNQKKSSEKEEKTEETKLWALEPLDVKGKEQTLYENENGSIKYEGYTKDSSGNFLFVVKYEGDLSKIKDNDTQFKVILDDSNSFIARTFYQKETRPTEDGEYRVYETDTPVKDKKIVRVDTSLTNNIDGEFDEENAITTEIEDSQKTKTLAGVEGFGGETKSVSAKRKTETMDVNVDSIEFMSDNPNEIYVSGSVEFKEDSDESPSFTFVQPETGQTDSEELSTDNTSGTYYKNTKTPFGQMIELDFPITKKSTLYFTIGDALFGFDLKTGKELKTVDITNYPNDEVKDYDTRTIKGFKDVNGQSVVNAYQVSTQFSHMVDGEDEFLEIPYSVSGYDTLSFKLGVGEEGKGRQGTYDVAVYGDDYLREDDGSITGEPLYTTKVTSADGLRELNVDLKGNSHVMIYVNPHLLSTEAEDEDYLPLIFSDVQVKK